MKKLGKFGIANLAGATIVILAWVSYWLMFGNGINFSSDTAVWGQFGDFLGGVINPLLTFISVILLINSVGLQRQANESLIELEDFKKTEVKFYNMLESQRVNFEHFKIYINNNGVETAVYNGEAVLYIENLILEKINDGDSKEAVKSAVESLDKSDAIFNVVRRFYLLTKLILSNIQKEKHEEYFETCRGMTDYRLICMLVISLEIFEWSIIDEIDQSSILDVEGLAEYRKEFFIK
ncbi:hypothetical protein A8A12_21665 [Serratia marcescens]|nr:hypothetical protein A8A12_21665 [Serratia marcescens]